MTAIPVASTTGFAMLVAKRREQQACVLVEQLPRIQVVYNEAPVKKQVERLHILPQPKGWAPISFAPARAERAPVAPKTAMPAPEQEHFETAHVESIPIPELDRLTNANQTRTIISFMPLPPRPERAQPAVDIARPWTASKMASANQRRFRLGVELTEGMRICKAALRLFGYDFMQLGERRLVCLKSAERDGMAARLCVEISVNAASNGLTEVSICDYSRGLEADFLRQQLIKLQQVIEQSAATAA